MAPQRGHARDPAETVLTVARIMDCLTARGAELHEAAGGDDDGSDHDDSYGDDGGGGCGGELGHHEGGGPGLEDERLDDEAYDPRRGRRGTRRQEMARFRLATVVYAIFDDRLMRAAFCKAVPAALGLHPNAAVGILMACLRRGRLPWWHSLVRKLGGPPSGETPLDTPGYTCPACKRPRNPARFPNPWTGWVRVGDGDGDDPEWAEEADPERAAPRQWRFVCQGCAYAARTGTVA